MAVAAWRTSLAVIFLLPFAWRHSSGFFKELDRRDLAFIILSGVCLGLHFTAWIQSLYLTSVASASTLVSSNPLFIAALGFVFLKERLSRTTFIAIAAAVGGAVLIGISDVPDENLNITNPRLGNILAAAAAMFVSVYLILGRVIRKKMDWLRYVFAIYTVTAITVVCMALFTKTPLLGNSPKLYALFALMALGPQIIGHGSLNYALRYFTPAFLALLSLSEPVGGSILAFWIFDEVPQPLALVGMAIILLAIAASILADRKVVPVAPP